MEASVGEEVSISEDSPAHLIFKFLIELPDTIREEIISFVLFYNRIISISGIPDTSQFNAQLKSFLLADDPMHRTGAVVCAAAVVDFMLENWAKDAAETIRVLQIAAAQNDSSGLTHAALQAPLRARRVQKVFEVWKDLRAGPLAPAALWRYGDRLLASH